VNRTSTNRCSRFHDETFREVTSWQQHLQKRRTSEGGGGAGRRMVVVAVAAASRPERK